MKLSMGFLLGLVLLFAQVIVAQTGRGEIENWVEVLGVCAEDGRELIEIAVGAEITEVIVNPSNPERPALVWYVGTAKARRFWIADDSDYVAVTAFGLYGGGFAVDEYFLGDLQGCDKPVLPSVPMNECLGMPFADFVSAIGIDPVSDGFVVDGNFYHFHETLSFLVPEDAIWEWDMYVDGYHVARFEQGEGMPCTITAIYPQGGNDE